MTLSKLKLEESFNEIKSALNMLKNDEGLPRNIKAKIDIILSSLDEDCELTMKVGKSLHMLDEISEDMNIQPFIRTQVWNVSSLLEKLNH